MTRKSHQHSSDEFGRTGLGSARRSVIALSAQRPGLGAASREPSGTDIEFELMPDVGEDEETPVWAAHASDQAVILIDGRTVGAGELNDYLQPGMMQADVTATDDGVISRIEIVDPN